MGLTLCVCHHFLNPLSGFITSTRVDECQLVDRELNSTKRQNFDWTKFKAFADDKLNVAKIMISDFDGVENIVRKGENAGYQHFLLFSQCFQKASFSGSLKVKIVW